MGRALSRGSDPGWYLGGDSVWLGRVRGRRRFQKSKTREARGLCDSGDGFQAMKVGRVPRLVARTPEQGARRVPSTATRRIQARSGPWDASERAPPRGRSARTPRLSPPRLPRVGALLRFETRDLGLLGPRASSASRPSSLPILCTNVDARLHASRRCRWHGACTTPKRNARLGLTECVSPRLRSPPPPRKEPRPWINSSAGASLF